MNVAAHFCNPSNWEIDTVGSGVQGWPGLHCSQIFFSKIQNKEAIRENSNSTHPQMEIHWNNIKALINSKRQGNTR